MLTFNLVISLDKRLSDQLDLLLAALAPVDTSALAAKLKPLEDTTASLDAAVAANP